MTEPDDESLLNLPIPNIGSALSEALDNMEATPMRRPLREFACFLALCLPFLALLTVTLGLRSDLGRLSVLWTAGVGLVWFASFFSSAFLAFVPARKQVVPRSRLIYQMLATNLLVLMALGLLAAEQVAGLSVTYEANIHSFAVHASGCLRMAFAAGALPGIIALLVFHRLMAVGGVSIGIGLGAAGGALSGIFLLFHCPVNERFHMALTHTSGIATAALFVGTASWLLLRGR